MDEFTLHEGEQSTLRTSIEMTDVGAGRLGTTVGGRGMARDLPNHLQGRRGSGKVFSKRRES